MQINLSGHHVDITDNIKTAVENKVAKIGSHYPCLTAMNVIVTVEKHAQIVEMDTNYEGAHLSAKASDDDLYVAINSAAKKLEASLSHRKGLLKADLHADIHNREVDAELV